MSRTADLVREYGIDPPWWAVQEPEAQAALKRSGNLVQELMKDDVHRVPIIETTNVARMIWGLEKPVGLYEFPCLAPPWESFWMEYQHALPDAARWHLEQEKHVARAERGGMSRETYERNVRLTRIERISTLWLSLGDEAQWPERHPTGDPLLDELETKWCVRLYLFLQAERRVSGPHSIYHVFLDARGRILDFQWMVPQAKGASQEECEEGQDGFTAMLIPMLYATSLLHCKNVTTEYVSAPPKVQEKRRRNRRPPLVRYQMVKVDPLTEKRRKVADRHPLGPGEPHALHIVPGHFSHFGDCCPGAHEPHGLAFGRLTGVYWMPMHARGNPRRGRVDSDYELVVPSV